MIPHQKHYRPAFFQFNTLIHFLSVLIHNPLFNLSNSTVIIDKLTFGNCFKFFLASKEEDVKGELLLSVKNSNVKRSQSLKEFLERLKKAQEEAGYFGKFLFPAETKEGVISNHTIYQFYKRLCEKLEIPVLRDNIRGTHAFRRNAITSFFNASGGDLRMASKIFGNSPNVINKHYDLGISLEKAKSYLDNCKIQI